MERISENKPGLNIKSVLGLQEQGCQLQSKLYCKQKENEKKVCTEPRLKSE